MRHADATQQGPAFPERLCEASVRRKAAQADRRNRHFIRGPIPMPWLEAAAALPGKALALGLLIWFKVGMEGPGPFTLPGSLLRRFGIGRKAAARGFNALEAAGLIRVDRHCGRLPRVTIVDVERRS